MSIHSHPLQRKARPYAPWIWASLALNLFAAPTLAAEAAPPLAVAYPAAPNAPETVVAVGKSRIINLPEAYTDVMIADPKIAEILPLNNRSVYVLGKALGSTALTIYGPKKRLISASNVVVSADIEGLKARLHDVIPAEQNIGVHSANQSIVLSGTVSSPSTLQQVLALAQSYAPEKVVNMLSVEGTQQVMLSVRFVEMQRSTAKNLRLNVNNFINGNRDDVGVITGDTNIRAGGALVESFGAISALFNNDLELLIDALETKNLAKTLAEPNLVAMSGDTASFLAGGEYPVPVAQQNNAGGSVNTTIEFKQFGVALGFTPTILKDGLINLVVNPEVSSIDPSVSIELGSIKIPGVKVRRAKTTVELRDGESFTIAGLLKEDYLNQTRQFPFVADMPVLGSLFRSKGYQRDETELVIVVTPHLVTPRRGKTVMPGERFVPPSDFEFFLQGHDEGTAKSGQAGERALMSGTATKGGIDGPHGHILF